jgi:uncharacterized protein YaaN involved in tellurite resistance
MTDQQDGEQSTVAASDVTPPAAAGGSSTTTLVLTPPDPVTAVSADQVKTVVPLDQATQDKLNAMAQEYVSGLITLDDHAPEFSQKVSAVETMGSKEIQDSAQMSNRMLDRPVRAMNDGVFDSKSTVSKSLVDLRETVTKLDPGKHDLLGAHKLLGVIPFGNKLREYFDSYRSAQSHINGIVQALYDGKDELAKDDADIDVEKQNLWATMQRLQQYAFMAGQIDAQLEARIAEIQPTDPGKAKVLQEDVLFYVRQKHQDLLTQLAVAAQGYMALDIIKKNNIELIKGVDRATTTTVAALRTAVMVAQALANEKLVLDQITAVNTTTGNLIQSTSELLHKQTDAVHAEAASSTINIDQLKAAFDNIYATIDSIDTYKVQALTTMKTTVDALQTEVNRAQTYLERSKTDHSSDIAAAAEAQTSSELTIPGGPKP